MCGLVDDMESLKYDSLRELNLDQIYPPISLRDVCIDSSEFESLVASIKKRGLLNPISVQQTDKGYKIIDGLHRFVACQQLNYKSIYAQVYV